MRAILNYFHNPRLSEIKYINIGDKVTAIDSEFNLTEGKEYKVLEVNSPTMITIKNDIDIEDIYSIECFKCYESFTNK